MLNILEKIQFGLSALVILGSLGAYLMWGIDTRQGSEMPEVRPVSPSARTLGKPGTKAAPVAPVPPPPSKEDQAVLDFLTKKQKVPVAGKRLEHVSYKVPKETAEFIAREPNLEPELNKAGHELLPGADGRMTRIRITNIDEDSMFRKFGIEDRDVIEGIDGEQIDFNDSKMNHLTRWSRLKDKLLRGEKLSIWITRNGQPMALEYQQ
jgi:hypothetical protein